MAVNRTSLSQQQLEQLIRTESENTTNVVFTDHIRQQMRKRKITDACVLATLRKGSIRRTPEPNLMYGTLECRMEYFCTGQTVGVIVAVSDTDPDLILVTAMYI